MRRVNRAAVLGGALLLTIALSIPVFGQASFNTSYQTTDFSGEWTSTGKGEPALAAIVGENPHEIGFTAELYDYSGLPYKLTAYHVQFLRAPDRPMYMDGRPHPPEWAPHTWAGFSTARFDGNTLVITTTHLKESYIRANTAMFSEKATVTEYLTLDGDLLTVTTLLEDPVYMEEPHLQSVSFRRNVHQELPSFPCTVGVENVQDGFPHFLPGKNPYIADTAKKLGVPFDAIRGGAETLYPEYREKLKTPARPQVAP